MNKHPAVPSALTTSPVEYCGAQLPAFGDALPNECALRPGHQGSHANTDGARWIKTARVGLPEVAGRCPACNGESLFLADGGHVTCSRIDCPDPSGADWMLSDDLVPRLQHELRYWQALFNPAPPYGPDQARATLVQVGRLHTSEISNEYGATECRTCRDQWPCETAVIIAALGQPKEPTP